MKRRINGWNRSWHKGVYDFKKWNQSFFAWKGYACHADSFHLLATLQDKMQFLI